MLAAAVPAAAAAQTQVVDEFKFGVLAHDVGLFDKPVESGSDINFEMLFTPPEFFRVIGSPRPHLGGSLNTAGNTNDGYFGLTWGITLIQNLFGWGGSVFANGSLGGALQDGYTNSAPPDRKKLGSTALFRESVELGYQLTPNCQRIGVCRPYVERQSRAAQCGDHRRRRAARLQVLALRGDARPLFLLAVAVFAVFRIKLSATDLICSAEILELRPERA